MTRSSHTSLRGGPEFDAVRALLARWGDAARDVGDDAAVLELPRGDSLVASVDATIEQHHFRQGWLTPREIGYRAAVAAVSDLAAMAATPRAMLVALALPDHWRRDIDAIADGLGEAALEYAIPIVGGNITAASELSLTLTVLGTARDAVRRAGLGAGDSLWVTGMLGGPGAALRALANGSDPAPDHRERFARPRARVHEARWLAAEGVTAGIDVSDGLASDLAQLAAASGVVIEVELERLPLARGVTAEQALESGEEYELIVGSRGDLDVAAFRERFGIPLTRIGRAHRGSADVVLTRAGARVANPPGYDHLSR
jgi:thiamine-monophosphate kinase